MHLSTYVCYLNVYKKRETLGEWAIDVSLCKNRIDVFSPASNLKFDIKTGVFFSFVVDEIRLNNENCSIATGQSTTQTNALESLWFLMHSGAKKQLINKISSAFSWCLQTILLILLKNRYWCVYQKTIRLFKNRFRFEITDKMLRSAALAQVEIWSKSVLCLLSRIVSGLRMKDSSFSFFFKFQKCATEKCRCRCSCFWS